MDLPTTKHFDVTVAGELNPDLIPYGSPEASSAERKSLANSLAVTLGSSSAILVHNPSMLGTRVGVITRPDLRILGRQEQGKVVVGGFPHIVEGCGSGRSRP